MPRPVIPKVIFLYDNDALEVRYSDESRLELSPCGAAMVFHPPSRLGEHPRHRLSQQVHKRTQFVTSEHRQKVLQALDFRNRFAKRPYLCEELVADAHDVVPLYASVNHVKWPKSPTQARVDILPDGSKKITSCDEYASLIVSPHGQDFSVCYLSKLSVEHTSQNALQPPSSPSLSQVSVKHSPRNYSGKKATEAVIYPYCHEQNELHSISEKSDVICGSAQVQQNLRRMENEAQNQCSKPDAPLGANNNLELHGLNCQADGNIRRQKEIPKVSTQIHPSAQIQLDMPQLTQSQSEMAHIISPQVQTYSHHLPQTQGLSNFHSSPDLNGGFQVDQGVKSHDTSDVRSSPLPHEISSISRSSTPDGLRMTIDSDTTLLHDTSDSDGVRYRQRHSSPTHQSSGADDVQLPFARLVQMKTPSSHGSFKGFTPVKSFPESFDASSEPCTPRDQRTAFFHPIEMPKQEGEGEGEQSLKQTTPLSLKPVSASSHSSLLYQSQEDLNKTLTNRNDRGGTLYENTPQNTSHGIIPAQLMRNPNEICPREDFNRAVATDITKSNKEMEHCRSTNQAKDLASAALHQTSFSPPRQSRPTAQNAASDYCSEKLSQEHRLAVSQVTSQMATPSLLTASTTTTSTSYFGPEQERESSSKVKYTWTTSHASKNTCPKEWTHPLMLALQGKSSCDAKATPTTAQKDKDCFITALPRPLPLTCPFQHMHKSSQAQHFDEDDDDDQSLDRDSNVGIFQKGRLKVVLSEGIIYRLVPTSGMTVVEVYPGDGSVLISQGAKALYFTHFIPVDGELEERMYSLKSLPPRCSKDFHPIERMLKTANRPRLMTQFALVGVEMCMSIPGIRWQSGRKFLYICLSWDKRAGKRNPPCWQKEMVAVVEPLSSSILEECVIDGLGKFTAYSNGRVRVVFDDRTSLDMISDFSPRLGTTAKVSTSEGEDGTIRLLLPSGNYMLVERKSAGPYSQYLKIADEWASWVNTSPAERHNFYMRRSEPEILEQAAYLELKKIKCFNYILDNTFQSQPVQSQNSSQNPSSHPPMTGFQSSNPNYYPPTATPRNADVALTPSVFSPRIRPQQERSKSRAPGVSPPKGGPGVTRPISDSDLRSMDTAMGFLSVRHALAQTSSMINDIEQFLHENNKS